MPDVLAFVSGKGGSGKTTSTLAIAGALHERGLRVLVVDFDPQGGASWAVGLEPRELPQGAGIAAFLNGRAYENALQIAAEGFAVLAGSAGLALLENDRRLPVMLLRLRDLPVDAILVDTPPGVGLLTQGAAGVADRIVIPLQPTPQDTYTLRTTLALLGAVKAKQKVAGAILTMLPPRAALTAPQREEVAALVPVLGEIPRTVTVAEAPNSTRSVVGYVPSSPAAEVYRMIARALVP